MLARYRPTLILLAVLTLLALACSVCTLGSGGVLPPPPDDAGGESDGADGGGGRAEAVPVPTLNPVPPPESAYDTLDALRQTAIPVRDRLELAERLLGLSQDAISTPEPKTYNLGDTEVFWADNTDTDEVFQVTAVLRYMTPHVYMWVEEGARFDQDQLARAAERFETQTYPIDHQYFGSEWSPGIDGDVRLHVLHVGDIGSVAGYYSSQSEYPIAAVPFSNEREMFFINVDNMPPGDPRYDGVLAHEFQHMIHWNVDRNEDSWVNEGLSELAVILNDYDASGFEFYFVTDPDLQLNNWPEVESTLPHYGASFLYHTYFLERFGDEALRAYVRNPTNGLDGVDETLAALGITDPQTGQPITTTDFFADWVIANYVDDPALGDGRFAYSLLPDFQKASAADIVTRLPATSTGTVHQFGTDYIELPAADQLDITFDGSRQVRLLPTDVQNTDGNPNTDDHFAWWSNRGDDSDMTLTTQLDLTGVSSATLEYDVWYLIEENWDYGYLMVSEDGQAWTVLETPYSSDLDPHGNGYGPGYTGSSAAQPAANDEGWLHETVDLSDYAGSDIYLRFEMITDDAVNQPGLLLDNVRVDEIGFYDDAESGSGTWDAQGFVRHDNVLPQEYVVQVLVPGNAPKLERLELDADNHGQITFEPGPRAREVVLVISGVTPYTTEPASYSYAVTAG